MFRPLGSAKGQTPTENSAANEALERAERINGQATQLYQQGRFAEALPLFQEVLTIREAELGENHPDVAISLNNLGEIYRAQGDYDATLPLFERAQSIRENIYGRDHIITADSLMNVAVTLKAKGNYDTALSLFERALSILERNLGDSHPIVAANLNHTAEIHQIQGNYAAAEPLFERALSIREAVLGENHSDIAISLNNLAGLYQAQGNHAAALPLLEKALPILEAAFGDNHPYVAGTLNNIAGVYRAQGNYSLALSLFERSLSMVEAAFGSDHPYVAKSLINIAGIHEDQGDYETAIPLLERAISISSESFSNNPALATSLVGLATQYEALGNYAAAQPLYERALALREKTLGETHPDLATSLNGLAGLHRKKGNYSTAISLLERALSIRENALGVDNPYTAISLNNLAEVYRAQGNYSEALPLYERALAIFELNLEDFHPYVATGLSNIALLYYAQGNTIAALPLLERALSISESLLGEDHPGTASILNNLAGLYEAQGNHSRALPLYERAVLINESALGESHPDVAIGLNNLAMLHIRQGNGDVAAPLLERDLSISETALGENHPYVATILNNLASLARNRGDSAIALPLLERASLILETALGEDHPDVARALRNQGVVRWTQRDIDSAIALFSQSSNIEEQNLTRMLLGASESRRQRYINTLKSSIDVNISINLEAAQDSPTATQLALATILRHKGRVLDAAINTMQRLRGQLSDQDREKLDELSDARNTLANLRFDGLGDRTPEQYQTEVGQLEKTAEALEEQLARSSAAFRSETETVDVNAIQTLLPDNAALIEFIRYSPFNPDNSITPSEEERYAAYILTKKGEVQVIDLGEAAPIDQLTASFRQSLSSRSANVKTIARQLDEQLMARIRSAVGAQTHLLISPDSHLNLIPFDALVDDDNRYLIESYQISYLTSGRDLLKFQYSTPSQHNPVIIANPDYNNASITQDTANAAKETSVDAVNLSFVPLPGTAEEGNAIAALLPEATLYTQTQATGTLLKQLQAPSILHIATHGFFLPDVEFSTPANPDSRSYGASFDITFPEAPTQLTPSNLENPLLRSGLALAGANVRSRDSGEDGIFTALEASGLNLYGTQLVVLSACETGIGTTSNGEGIYGLRRAFVAAGSESQLMSLWQVDDYGTSELMQLFYQNLMNKEQGRSEALRSAQLEMMNTGTYAHPYYWSSFIFSGNWRPLE